MERGFEALPPVKRMVLTVDENPIVDEVHVRVIEKMKDGSPDRKFVIEVDDSSKFTVQQRYEFDWKGAHGTGENQVLLGTVVNAWKSRGSAIGVRIKAEDIGKEDRVGDPNWKKDDGSGPDKEERSETQETPLAADSTPETAEDAEPRLPEEQVVPESIEDRELHAVVYENGRLYAKVGAEHCRIENAEDMFLLPGDEIEVTPTGERRVTATSVKYTGRSTILGRLKYEGDSVQARRTGEHRLQFIVRGTGPDSSYDKFRFSVEPVTRGMTEEQVRELVENDGYLIFNRNDMKVEGEPLWAQELGSYEISQRALLTNLGIEQHDAEAQMLKQGEAEQLNAIRRRFSLQGLGEKQRGSLFRQAAPAMERLLNGAVRDNQIEDMRGGGRHTFAVDSEKTKMRDDAFSIGPSKLGEEWRQVEIHIANPSKFLLPAGSPIDRASAERGAAIILAEKSIPLLPGLVTALASLEQGFDRRALSFVFDARLDSKKPVEIRNLRFTESAIRVTNAISPEAADKLIHDPEAAEDPAAAAAWKELSQILVEFHRRTSEGKTRTKKPQPPRSSVTVVSAANVLFNRAAATGFSRLRRSEFPRLRSLQDAVTGIYEHVLPGLEGERSRSETATTPDPGRSLLRQSSYLSSPLRSYSSLVGVRALAFLAKVTERAAAGRDISRKSYRRLVQEYALDVVGMPLSEETLALPDEQFVEKVEQDAKVYVEGRLERISEREKLVGRIARASQAAKLLDKIGRRILEAGPFPISGGIVLFFNDARQTPSVENGVRYAYAETGISRSLNRWLYDKYAPKDVGNLALQVKFALPDGMPLPTAPSRLKVEASIMTVDLDANRLVIELDTVDRATAEEEE